MDLSHLDTHDHIECIMIRSVLNGALDKYNIIPNFLRKQLSFLYH